MKTEIWKSVTNYEGYYEVSNLGRVRSKTRLVERNVPRDTSKTSFYTYEGRLINFYITGKGYHRTTLNGKKHLVHRLVANAFLPKVELISLASPLLLQLKSQEDCFPSRAIDFPLQVY